MIVAQTGAVDILMATSITSKVIGSLAHSFHNALEIECVVTVLMCIQLCCSHCIFGTCLVFGVMAGWFSSIAKLTEAMHDMLMR